MTYAANYSNNKTLRIVPLINGVPQHNNVVNTIKVEGKRDAKKICLANNWKPWNF